MPSFSLRPLNKNIIDEISAKLNAPVGCICSNSSGVSLPRMKLLARDRYGINMNTYFCLNCGSATVSPYFDRHDLDLFYRSTYHDLYGRSSNSVYVKSRQRERAKLFSQIATLFLSSSGTNEDESLNILEIGSSFGECIKALSNMAAFTKSDLSIVEPSLERSNFVDSSKSRVQVFSSVEDVQDGMQDLIFCDHVLEHVLDAKAQLRTIKMKLKENSGIFVFAVPILERFFEVKNKPLAINFHIAHLRYFSVLSLMGLAREAGFSIVEVTNSSLRDAGEGVFVMLDSSNSFFSKMLLGDSGLALARPIAPPIFMRILMNASRYLLLFVAIRISIIKNLLSFQLGGKVRLGK